MSSYYFSEKFWCDFKELLNEGKDHKEALMILMKISGKDISDIHCTFHGDRSLFYINSSKHIECLILYDANSTLYIAKYLNEMQ